MTKNDQIGSDPGSIIDQKNDQKKGPNTLKNGLVYRVLLTAVNNYLIGYRKAYENVVSKPFSEVRRKYEEMLEQKKVLEEKLK